MPAGVGPQGCHISGVGSQGRRVSGTDHDGEDGCNRDVQGTPRFPVPSCPMPVPRCDALQLNRAAPRSPSSSPQPFHLLQLSFTNRLQPKMGKEEEEEAPEPGVSFLYTSSRAPDGQRQIIRNCLSRSKSAMRCGRVTFPWLSPSSSFPLSPVPDAADAAPHPPNGSLAMNKSDM